MTVAIPSERSLALHAKNHPDHKAMTDGITSAGVLPDDSDEHVWGSWWHRPTVDRNLAGTARVAIWFEPVKEVAA